MKERVRKYIEEHRMICPGDTLVAGVSGGADSLCLFLLLHELSGEMDFHLHVVHVHHGLRETAKEDLEFVEKLCSQMQVPCTIARVDAAASARQWGTGVEEAGRRLRYDVFRQVCAQLEEQEKGARQKVFRIAVAHHREDQAETVLFHLCRGTDLRGARGMLPVNGQIIRPLLGESRASIEEYLTERGFSWQEDETNTDTGYTRNYIRREILPRLEAGVHTGAVHRIAQFADACAEAEGYLAGVTERALQRCSSVCTRTEELLLPKDHMCTAALCLDSLLREDAYLQGRILYKCLADSSVTGKDMGTVHVDALRGLCRGGKDGQLSMPSRVTVVRSAGKLFFCRPAANETAVIQTGKQAETEAESAAAQGVPDETAVVEADSGAKTIYPLSEAEYTCCVRDFDGSMSSIPGNECTKWFDYDKIGTFPVFRTRQPGDCMRIFSTGHAQIGSDSPGQKGPGDGICGALQEDREMICKKLARIMLDGKIPAGIRDKIVLPFCGNEALWIPGLRMGDSCKVTSSTVRILEIRRISDGTSS